MRNFSLGLPLIDAELRASVQRKVPIFFPLTNTYLFYQSLRGQVGRSRTRAGTRAVQETPPWPCTFPTGQPPTCSPVLPCKGPHAHGLSPAPLPSSAPPPQTATSGLKVPTLLGGLPFYTEIQRKGLCRP